MQKARDPALPPAIWKACFFAGLDAVLPVDMTGLAGNEMHTDSADEDDSAIRQCKLVGRANFLPWFFETSTVDAATSIMGDIVIPLAQASQSLFSALK